MTRCMLAIVASILSSFGIARAQEVCDDFSEDRGQWTFRVPRCGPSFSLGEREGYLRFGVPDSATSGANFDSWSTADRAPTFERYDMGDGDWTISTRLEWDDLLGAPAGAHHVGLFFGFGRGDEANDVVFWGEYGDMSTLAVERSGDNIRPVYAFDGTPVSLQVAKSGDSFTFRHRQDDELDAWFDDVTLPMTGDLPVGRVGLIVKTWGGGAPEVTADFDYFCLDVPDGQVDEDDGDIGQLSPLGSLSCERDGDDVVLAWTVCEGMTEDILISVNGEVVATLDPDETEATLSPPFPGGSILVVSVDNQSGFAPLECSFAGSIFEDCDEFENELDEEIWTLRAPIGGPSVSLEENPDFLRFTVPVGNFDNWANVDRAPTFERDDMGDGDWSIRTRMSWDDVSGAPVGSHHVGLMVGFGSADRTNDVVYWGEYGNESTLRVERTGSAQTPQLPYDGAPVSLQLTKSGGSYEFSHRQDDDDPWTVDATSTLTSNLPAPRFPVGRVGLIIKTWGGNAARVVADFDYFCLEIPDSPPRAVIESDVAAGTVPFAVSFSAAGSVDPSGSEMTYGWDFGDGESGEGETVAHTYTVGGLHTVTLTATDDEGNSGTATATIIASDDVSPWTFSRVGDRGLEGGVFADDSDPEDVVYGILAGGSTFGSRSDHGQFLHRRLAGDFSVSVKVERADLSGSPSARIGLMARADLARDAAMVLMALERANDGLVLRSRVTSGTTARNESVSIDPPRSGVPFWLRLATQGATFIGSVSSDGETWEEYSRKEVTGLDVAELEVGVGAGSGGASVTASYTVSGLEGFDALQGTPFHRGDADGSGDLQLTDGVFILSWLFLQGETPPCMDAADSDDSETIELTDAVLVLSFLFLGGGPPPEPGPPGGPCGLDPGGDAVLGCESYTGC